MLKLRYLVYWLDNDYVSEENELLTLKVGNPTMTISVEDELGFSHVTFHKGSKLLLSGTVKEANWFGKVTLTSARGLNYQWAKKLVRAAYEEYKVTKG